MVYRANPHPGCPLPLTLPVLLLLGFGCTDAATLLPALDLAGDPVLAALDADSVVVGGGDGPLFRRPGLLPPALAAARVERARLGCAALGCVVLADGDFSDLDLPGLRAAAGTGGVATAAPRGVDLALSDGSQLALRRLTPDKLALGDREALARVADQAAGFDPARLVGEVPEGSLWGAVLDGPAAVALGEDRLPRLALSPTVAPLLDAFPDDVELVTASLDEAEGRVRLAVRARYPGEATAWLAAHQLRSALAAEPTGAPWQRALLASAQVVQVGRRVEVRGQVDRALLPPELP